jgi:hypothetical protein
MDVINDSKARCDRCNAQAKLYPAGNRELCHDCIEQVKEAKRSHTRPAGMDGMKR